MAKHEYTKKGESFCNETGETVPLVRLDMTIDGKRQGNSRLYCPQSSRLGHCQVITRWAQPCYYSAIYSDLILPIPAEYQG